MVPAQNVAALPQIQKETVNLPEKRNEKSQFAPPLRQPPREAIEKSHEVTPKTLQNTSIQAAASGSRVPDIPLTLETDLPPQKIVLALQRQQQIPRTPEDHSVNPSPYTIDWLEAKYSHLLTDSDCDSGIMDVSERGEESNPSGQIRQSQSYMNSQPISYDSIDQNSLKETVIRIPARPKPSFSAPVRKPYKPLSQEVLGSQGTSQVNAHSHPNSQNSWSSQLSHESYSQPQDW
ncbi:hypothetical protein BIW11_05324 [Tropilaelaps mercedesae]|uniref:Uncharacterized protein n=1 Tax=Tropilaelaps mercedesae TaxID=418985 RepID=A0A1V9Y391_9ACAR|nr:hypothetical protein BIW11_05324 [Tropilaelaps mercedesae]